MAPPELRLLGSAGLVDGGGVHALERKTAAMLAFLALEGETPRQRLAALLWPDSDEAQARTNLRKVLVRLRRWPGLVAGSDPLALGRGVRVDLLRVGEAEDEMPAATVPELLAGHDYDGLGELAEWVEVWRERLRERHLGRLEEHAQRLEAAGDLQDALALARGLVLAEPVSEVHHRRLMRLHYLLGDRAAALAAYQRCQEVLRRELELEPLPETRELAAQIERMRLPVPAFRPEPLPVILLRPPLVGRERAWASLERAWQERRPALVSGAAGVGKTRLVRDFLALKGECLYLDGRPGDQAVPYASVGRMLRGLLGRSDLEPPDRVAGQLGRLLPDLFTPPPAGAAADEGALHWAFASVLDQGRGSLPALWVDDFHHLDPGSVGLLGSYLVRAPAMGPAGGTDRSRAFLGFRPEALTEPQRQVLAQLRASGPVIEIELGQLDEEAVAALLGQLGREVPGGAEAARRLSLGNPLLLLELLKQLHLDGGSAELETGSGPLLERRLDDLTETARRFLGAVVLAGGETNLELSAAMLGVEPLELTGPLRELEAALLLDEGRLVHDTVGEMAVRALPAAVQRLFRLRAARFLEEAEPDSPRAAEHWLACGRKEQAVAGWLRSAAALLSRGLPAEAVRLLEQALAHVDNPAEQAELQVRLARQYSELGRYLEAEELLERVLPGAEAPSLRAAALYVQADLLSVRDRLSEADEAIREGAALAEFLDDAELLADFSSLRMFLDHRLGNHAEALERARQLLELHRAEPVSPGRVALLSNIGVLLRQLGRQEEALPYLQEARHLARRWGMGQQEFSTASNLAVLLSSLGRLDEALELTEEALAIGPYHGYDTVLGNKASLLLRLGRYPEAVALCSRLAVESQQPRERIYAYARLGELHGRMGEVDQATMALDSAILLAAEEELPDPRARVLINALRFGSEEQRGRVLGWLEGPLLERASSELKAELQKLLAAGERERSRPSG